MPCPNDLMVLGTEVCTAQWTPSGVHRTQDTHRTRARGWVEGQHSLSPPQLPDEELRKTRSGTVSPMVRSDQVLAFHNPAKPMTGPPAGPQRTAGERVSCLQQYSHPSSWNLFGGEVPPLDQQVRAQVMMIWDPGGHPGSSKSSSSAAIPSPVPATDAATDALLALLADTATQLCRRTRH